MSIEIIKHETGKFALKVNSAYFYGIVDSRIAFVLLEPDKKFLFDSVKNIRRWWHIQREDIVHASKYNVYIPIYNSSHPGDITLVRAYSREALYEALEDVFVTAIEGGSDYWMDITDVSFEEIKRATKSKAGISFSERVLYSIIFCKVSVRIVDAEDEEEILCNLDFHLLSERYQKLEEILTNRNIVLPEGKGKGCEDALRKAMCNLLQEEYDAEDTDVIMQYLCLEHIVYG
jgi:hypothetical protein